MRRRNMKRLAALASTVICLLFFWCIEAAGDTGSRATVHVRIVNIYNTEDLGIARVQTFQREYGDVPSSNFADHFKRNVAIGIPYDFYKLCMTATGFWPACTEVPVYQPQVWVVLGLRVGAEGLVGLSELRGEVKGESTKSRLRLRLMGLYSGVTVDAETDRSGRFQMSGVPPGTSVLVTLEDDRIVDTRPIEIPAVSPVEIELPRQDAGPRRAE